MVRIDRLVLRDAAWRRLLRVCESIRLSAIWRVVSACFDSCRESPKSKDSQALRMRSYTNPHPEERSFERVSKGEGLSRSEEHTSELQSLMRISYAVFCLKKKK